METAMRKMLHFAAAASLLACAGATTRPTSLRELTTSDLTNCLQRAKSFMPQLARVEVPVKLTLMLYVDADGAVPAAYIHDQLSGDPSKILNACLTDASVGSKFQSENTDYTRPEPLFFQGLTALRVPLNEQPPGKLNRELAQETLQFAGWATPTDKGYGYYYVQNYPKAIEQFKAAIQAKAGDARAQRGYALTLLDSGGDVKEARDAAEKAAKADPDSVAAHETLVKICLKQNDPKCVLDEWERATLGEMKDGKVVKPVDEKQKIARSYELAQIQDQVKAIHQKFSADLEKQDRESREKAVADAQKKADPTGCGATPEGDERTLCFVKYCFGAGAGAYAKSLKTITGQDYTAGEWKVGKGKEGPEVTVPIRGKKGTPPHDAIWVVKIGETVDMKPTTIDANNISLRHNACRK
jgi:tetratricopeptide (TPR) repeat protein